MEKKKVQRLDWAYLFQPSAYYIMKIILALHVLHILSAYKKYLY